MAVGEKRLLSLINATVSHEMRNPTNSIQSQVQFQQKLNMKLRDVLENFKPAKIQYCKRKLEKYIMKQEDSTSMQMSATKILGFLINDMLDYGQLSAGKFRKFYK